MIGTKPYRDPQSERNEVEELLDRYFKLNNLDVYYVLASQDGVSRAKSLDVTMHEDILAPMAAALYGAARTAHREINKSAPKYVRLESEDMTGLIVPVGENYVLLVSEKPGEQGLESKINEIRGIARELATKV
jgi:predicted regulator of Ras-like GTPase activity (Roadblock/LC7/MglB family)